MEQSNISLALNDVEPAVSDLVAKLLARIRDFSVDGKSVDVLDSFRRLSLDLVGALFLGQSFHALDTSEAPPYLAWMDNMFISLGTKYAFPWLFPVLAALPIKAVRDMLDGPNKIGKFGDDRFDEYIETNGRHPQKRDLLTKFLAMAQKTDADASEKVMTDHEMSCEVGNMVFAGTDTTGTALTYLFWELAKHPNWQQELRVDLRKCAKAGPTQSVPGMVDITNLPILNAVVNETLRLHPSAPASLRRSIPSGGRVLDGVFVTPNTVVSTQAYTIHRDPAAFPHPDEWRPERWLGKLTGDDERAKELFLPFSKGSRNFLGMGLAMVVLKLCTAHLILELSFRLAQGTTEEGMQMLDHFLAIPKAGKCDLIFEKA